MQIIEKADFLIRESSDLYQEKSQDYLTSHQLADFRKCPYLYYRKRLGLIPDEQRPAYLIGRAAHTLILEGRKRFDEEYAVGGPVNPKTGRVYGANTKAFAEWAEEQGKPVLTREQFDRVLRMHLAVAQHEEATDLLSEGIPEGVVRAEYCGVNCQIRMDFFDPFRGVVDLKTTDDLSYFEADARRYGYAHQMAFYRAVLAEVVGIQMPVFLIGIEKREPFRCGVWQVSEEVLGICQKENEDAIERLKECEALGVWPSGYESLRIFDCI